MGSEYDRKFEEMKKYIPFLESMIKRLESTTTSAANPRQAQLDKIRSLRDLLLDKKKRMKMDNLLKCEQVLVNLYAKVEQRDTIPVVKDENMDSRNSKVSSDLEVVRNKLKSVVQRQNIETLPEIARASEIEEICEPGSKEPALFQRRPNRSSVSPTKCSPNNAHETKVSPKSHLRRNYTRVLVSPEPRTSRWPGPDDAPTEKPLFSRRSPRRSPRRNSPSYNKKERKKSAKEKKSRKDLNITLKVPEESLDSLNTEDILTRIINCSDGDVDIDTLRELRSQILGELKQTGSNDDISELILKSYSDKKSKSKNKNKKKFEVEEGEISDSESEAIENIYGSLVVVGDKDKKSGLAKNALEKNNQQRKIQICLVINSDKDSENKTAEIDLSESGAFENNVDSSKDVINLDSATPSPNKNKDKVSFTSNLNQGNVDVSLSKEKVEITQRDTSKDNITAPLENNTDENEYYRESNKTDNESRAVVSESIPEKQEIVSLISPAKVLASPKSIKTSDKILESPSKSLQTTNESCTDSTKEKKTNVANFYKPLVEHEDGDETQSDTGSSKPQLQSSLKPDSVAESTGPTLPPKEDDSNDKKEETTEIPLLNEPTLPPKAKKDVLSEIDILQALKNEILSETIPIAASEEDTPALHLPKISKVALGTESGPSAIHQKTAKANELPKKRISIENYKKKSASVSKSLFLKKRSNAAREEMIKKQSLKLTEKECERFKLPVRLSLDDDTDDISDDDLLDDDNALSLDDIYGDLAPQSPDQENYVDDSDETPVLIPAEPVKPAVDNTIDVDMRNVTQPPPACLTNVAVPTSNFDNTRNAPKIEPNRVVSDTSRPPPVDPRIRREPLIKDSPNPFGATNFEGTPRPSQFPNIPPLLGMTPVYTPSYAPSMTPMRTPNARSYEMTPTRQSFENMEEPKKHVYAPSFSMNDRETDYSGASERPAWETNKPFSEDHRPRRDGRNSLRWEPPPNRDSQPNYNPRNDKYHLDRRETYSKPDPGPNFGWSDCPGTPGSSFGRLEAPMTPSHSFGRSDGPATPSHPFGKSDCPSTPSHSFGRSECPSTPNHPFGRADFKDPRLNRRPSEYETRIPSDENDRGYQNDRSYNRGSSYKSHRTIDSDSPRSFDSDQYSGRNDRYEQGGRYSKSNAFDSPRRFERERSVGRSDKYYANERNYDRTRREPSLHRSSSRDESNRLYTRNRESRFDNRYSDNFDEIGSRRDQRERSIGRTTPRDPVRASSRAPSVSRSCVKEVEYDNSSSKFRARQTFTIDTSVNATFQKLIESGKGIQVFDYSFDARRRRASSVGRSLVRESSVGRTLVHVPKSTEPKFFERRKNFQRASSVGRVLVEMKKDKKSFQEIKADFESYRLNSKDTSKVVNTTKQQKITAQKTNMVESTNEDLEKPDRILKQDTKKPYSPRKNNRDPRMRKDQKEHRNRDDRRDSHSLDRRRSGIVYSSDNIAKGTIMGSGFGVKNYKIPKIKRPEPEPIHEPKVTEDVIKVTDKVQTSTSKADSSKKASVEKSKGKKGKDSDEESLEKTKCTVKSHSGKKISIDKKQDKKEKGNNSDDGIKIKTKAAKQIDIKHILTSNDDSEKRITRSSRRSDSYLEENSKRPKRIRRPVIDDSDSETEVETKTENSKLNEKIDDVTKSNLKEVSTKPKANAESNLPIKPISSTDHEKHTESERPVTANETKNSLVGDTLDSCFAIDDLEIFSDNIVSDPVIDNINDLIADLDEDIGAAKSGHDNFTDEIEKMMGTIDGNEETTLGDISELIEKDLNECNDKLKQNMSVSDAKALNRETEWVSGSQNTVIPNVDEPVKEQDLKTDNQTASKESKLTEKELNTNKQSVENEVKSSQEQSNLCNDEIVSTTQLDHIIDTNKIVNDECIKDKPDQKTANNENSTPDSTIAKKLDGADKVEESLPDSTMEIHSEVSNDVTSTHDTEKSSKENADPSSSRKEISAIESFGSLLSILQDKSKIKELLSMLGDQSGESEKIKKKLEKLSEIVSDEEEVIDDTSKTCKPKNSDNPPEVHASEDCEPKRSDISPDSHLTKKSDIAKEAVNDNDVFCEANQQRSSDEGCNTDAKDCTLENDKNDKQTKHSKVEIKQVFGSEKEKTNDLTDNDDPTDEFNEDQNEETVDKTEIVMPKKRITRKRKKGKFVKGNKPKSGNKPTEVKKKLEKPKIQKKKKVSRELQTLQNDIKEMFMCNDVLNATGIRMCRLAKMVDKKDENDSTNETAPVVVLQKFKKLENMNDTDKKFRKQPRSKSKSKVANDPETNKKEKSKHTNNYKPGPKSKTKQNNEDPYEFETDSISLADTNTTRETDVDSSDSDNESLDSSGSFGSSEVLADIKKKPKKKTRGGWKAGVIKKHKKKKDQEAATHTLEASISPLLQRKPVTIPDMNCFTDKMYCFQRNVLTYDCRLCHYSGTEIVNHYKKQHAHTEVPLSRMEPTIAKKAIQQCEEVNFQAISKIPSEKYTCRFCYKEFSKNRVALEMFFWHVVSVHTGEYKHLCFECVNVTRCPFNLDIPPPPKEIKGQLIGYICGKCNFTQISLENLKTHVIVRHNDEQTEVYTINLGAMSNKAMKGLLRRSLTEKQEPRTLRSSRSNVSGVEAGDERSEVTGSDRVSEISSTVPKIELPDPQIDAALKKVKKNIKPGPLRSKLTFETDEQERNDKTSVKVEEEEYQNEAAQVDDNESVQSDRTLEPDQTDTETLHLDHPPLSDHTYNAPVVQQSGHTYNLDTTLDTSNLHPHPKSSTSKDIELRGATDVFKEPHFKVNFKETGTKEYVCCVNGVENHYKTTLLISLKKHVQTKHSENWDGYCCVCKVIVTLQGVRSSYKDCLTHFLDKHMDDFPVLQKVVENVNEDSRSSLRSSIDTVERTESPKTYIAVRPLSDLISKDVEDAEHPASVNDRPFPKIEQVVSLGANTVQVPQTSPVYPTAPSEVFLPKKPFQYEEVQAEVMSKKHRIVLDTMMPKEMLVRVYKCAGRFCSFTSDSAEDALVHASAHKQLGGEGALDCAYCNFDAAGNAIDLVMHVFKEHGRCQYSCVLCFYRASVDQLVGAHFVKAHNATGKPIKVLQSTCFVNPVAADTTDMLSRETAVVYYICSHGNCKFRTYTPGKYCEHLQQKHETEESHPCNLCEFKSSPPELIKHMKEHGLKLYQCTWCLHGASSESEMLQHAAGAHPTKKPQAYLRIITNKDSPTDLRVLPLIYLTKHKVPVELVTPSKSKEDPTKEAERSIELEKLIRHTTQLTESMTESVAGPAPQAPVPVEVPAEIAIEPSDPNDSQTVEAIENSLLSSPQKNVQEKDDTTPAVKNEPKDPTINHKTEILYCLDSDEEELQHKSGTRDADTTQEVIDLSDDEPTDPLAGTLTLKELITAPVKLPPTKSEKQKYKKVSAADLYKCPKCEQVFKNGPGLKRHAINCCLELTTLRCPHVPCPIVLSNMTQLVNHYNTDHNLVNCTKHYYCGVCDTKWPNLNATKRHLREKHDISKVIVTSGVSEDGVHVFTLDREIRAVGERPKRKSSVEAPKKYGIDDVDKLPINPILDSLVYCGICEFSTKVRVNMVRHLQLHAERQPVAQTAPVNPVPHLETNEMHFDRMVNLASSSAQSRPDRPAGSAPTVAPDAVSRYPKYVSDRQRHTCGAKDCTYISVDEAMFRIHWETLHSGSVDYRCAHCPPHQHLNTARPLSAQRIVAHLKMHDAILYACSLCSYYHYKAALIEKHIADTHKNGQMLIVREEGTTAGTNLPSTAAPTMDLKPWQCGVCNFKSMLRAEVVEHCSKTHQTKMQFKCAYCPFRTSAVESITKHQSNAHPARAEDVFYYYYREGTVPDEADGTPRWQRQRQKAGIEDSEVKTEPEPDSTAPAQPPTPTPVDLNLVKKEVEDRSVMSVEDLCRQYGQFCEPNGIKFKCPLCKTVSEQSPDDMRSHLYEELKYRRWGCALCSYKAYHRVGLNAHMVAEHNRNFFEPTQLPTDANVEKWVTALLNHQDVSINKNKENLAKLKIITEKPTPGPSKVVEPPKPVRSSSNTELEQAFGPLGAPKNESYCCPKCSTLVKDEREMRNHLESELTKIRWCCTNCANKFQTYHEAQFHCKSAHSGHTARPKEALRDPALRSAWIAAVIKTQKLSMKPETAVQINDNFDLTDPAENSLLVVRYEEAVRPDELATRKRPATPESDSDDESALEIYEPEVKKVNDRQCPYCDHTTTSKHKHVMREHILRHYNLKSISCGYCNFTSHRKQIRAHLDTVHPGLPHHYRTTEVPNCLPSEFNLKSNKKKVEDRSNIPTKVCLQCEKSVPDNEISTHSHANRSTPEFGDKGEVIVKCCICLTLRKNLASLQNHYNVAHPDIAKLNYAFYKLQVDTREVQTCGICKRRFTFMRDLRIHHSSMHKSSPFHHTTVPYRFEEDDHETRGKRKVELSNPHEAKRVARKSTSKLPNSTVARKSTTKLPFVEESDLGSDEEFSYYGTKPPSLDRYANVKTKMPLYNSMVEIGIKKLSGILQIDPKVVLTDCKDKPTQ